MFSELFSITSKIIKYSSQGRLMFMYYVEDKENWEPIAKVLKFFGYKVLRGHALIGVTMPQECYDHYMFIGLNRKRNKNV